MTHLLPAGRAPRAPQQGVALRPRIQRPEAPVASALVGLAKSSSAVIGAGRDSGWGAALARDIDAAILRLSADRDVLTVAVTPLVSTPGVSTDTVGVIVTVVWRAAESSER